MGLTWRDSMSVKIAKVDDDHRRLIALINTTEASINAGEFGILERVFAKIPDFLRGHFETEEQEFEALGLQNLDAHKRAHQEILRRATQLQQGYSSTQDSGQRRQIAGALLVFLNQHLVEHVLKEDLKIKPMTQGQPGNPAAAQVEGSMQTFDQLAEAEAQRKKAARGADMEYALPEHLAHLLNHLTFISSRMPPTRGAFDSFKELADSAIMRRIDKILVFFQRNNPAITRELPTFFLASPAFAEKFHEAIRKFILPELWESRQVRQLSASLSLENLDNEEFWGQVGDHLKESILIVWRNGWDELRPIEVRREDGTKVLKVKDGLKGLREALTPDNPEGYDLPKIGNREIDVFKSLLDTRIDWWRSLNVSWQIFFDIYEQEKNPRVFQTTAREGALRDSLLAAFQRFPPEWADFMVLCAHRVFPRVNTGFIEQFTHNFGHNVEQREGRLPYTMRYLAQVKEHPEIREREQVEELERRQQEQELRDYFKNRTA